MNKFETIVKGIAENDGNELKKYVAHSLLEDSADYDNGVE